MDPLEIAWSTIKYIFKILLFIFHVFQSKMPIANIQDMYVPALNTKLPIFNSTTTTATFISFNLELKNELKEVGVRYENVNLAFYYVTPKSSFPIANYTVPGFYQGHDKTAYRIDVVETRGMPWLDAFAAVSNCSTVDFKVELSSSLELKRIFGIYSKRKELLLEADVKVNGYGEKAQKKGIRMKRRAHKKVKDAEATRELDLRVVDSDASVYSS